MCLTLSFAVVIYFLVPEQGQNLECLPLFHLLFYLSSLLKKKKGSIVDTFFFSLIFPCLSKSFLFSLPSLNFSFSFKSHVQKADVHTESGMDHVFSGTVDKEGAHSSSFYSFWGGGWERC